MPVRQFSRLLKNAQRKGARIVCSVQPYLGREVVNRPRSPRDPRPWLLRSAEEAPKGVTVLGSDYRFSGRECHAERFTVVAYDSGVWRVWDTVQDTTTGPNFNVRFKAEDRAYDLNYPQQTQVA